MELYEEILARVLKDLILDDCYQAMAQIKAIMEDDNLTERQCLARVDRIVGGLRGIIKFP